MVLRVNDSPELNSRVATAARKKRHRPMREKKSFRGSLVSANHGWSFSLLFSAEELCCRLCSRAHVKFFVDMSEMSPYGAEANSETFADFLVELTLCQLREDFLFSWGEELDLA